MGLIRDTAVEGITEFLTVKYLGIFSSSVSSVLSLQMKKKKKKAMAQRADLLKLTEFS